MEIKKSRKPIAERSFGGFTVKIYFNERKPKECYATVGTASDVWYVRLGLGHEGYGYLLKSAMSGDWDSVEAWIYANYAVGAFLGSEQGFAEDVIKAISDYSERIDAVAKESAKSVTEQDEIVAESEMRDAIEYGEATDEQRAERKGQMREEFRRLVDEIDGV